MKRKVEESGNDKNTHPLSKKGLSFVGYFFIHLLLIRGEGWVNRL